MTVFLVVQMNIQIAGHSVPTIAIQRLVVRNAVLRIGLVSTVAAVLVLHRRRVPAEAIGRMEVTAVTDPIVPETQRKAPTVRAAHLTVPVPMGRMLIPMAAMVQMEAADQTAAMVRMVPIALIIPTPAVPLPHLPKKALQDHRIRTAVSPAIYAYRHGRAWKEAVS